MHMLCFFIAYLRVVLLHGTFVDTSRQRTYICEQDETFKLSVVISCVGEHQPLINVLCNIYNYKFSPYGNICTWF
jgi:hypothetical protein